jgi:hypothetical protein
MHMEIQASALADLIRQLGASDEGAAVCRSAVALLKGAPQIDDYRQMLDEHLGDFITNSRLFIRGLAPIEDATASTDSLGVLLNHLACEFDDVGEPGSAVLMRDARRVIQSSMQWA